MVSVAVPAYATKKAKDVSGEFLKEKMGYDFVNLVTKLAIFYVISFLISKYMEAVDNLILKDGINPMIMEV